MITLEKSIKTPIANISYLISDPQIPSKNEFNRVYDIVIVGGGPAGAYLANCLASHGKKPVIFDYSYQNEKPLIGAVNQQLVENFPLIQKSIDPGYIGNELHLISPSGHKVISEKKRLTAIYRTNFNKFLLNSAIKNGSIYIPEKVTSITKEQNLWKLKTPQRIIFAHILAGADGVKSIVRKTVVKPHRNNDLAIGIGYHAKGQIGKISLLKFFNNRNGFLWTYGTDNKYFIGITDNLSNSSGLKIELDKFISAEFKNIQPYKAWSALTPKASSPEFFKQPCTGKNWILLGDAAGHVDPVSGKGIPYALWSAELASQALLASDLRLYDSLWREEYGKELMRASNQSKLLCKPDFLDNAINFAQRSKSFSNIIFDLVTSNGKWSSTGKRLLTEAPRILFEAATA